jgi:hypothetical protein
MALVRNSSNHFNVLIACFHVPESFHFQRSNRWSFYKMSVLWQETTVAGVFELEGSSSNSSGGDESGGGGHALAAAPSPDWPSCYALDEALDAPTHPLVHDVPPHPLLAMIASVDDTPDTSTTAAASAEAQSQGMAAGALGAHVNTQLFLSRGHTATQLHRDPFDNV